MSLDSCLRRVLIRASVLQVRDRDIYIKGFAHDLDRVMELPHGRREGQREDALRCDTAPHSAIVPSKIAFFEQVLYVETCIFVAKRFDACVQTP